jgi:hypothetical protein
MDQPYTDNPGVVNQFSNGAPKTDSGAFGHRTDPLPDDDRILGSPGGDLKGIPEDVLREAVRRVEKIVVRPAMFALDAAMAGDTMRLRALVSTMSRRDRDHLAKSADRLAMMADDDLL